VACPQDEVCGEPPLDVDEVDSASHLPEATQAARQFVFAVLLWAMIKTARRTTS
jgi:hypothetical protein